MINKIWISLLALLSVAATTTFVIMYSTTKENRSTTVCNERNEMARGDECVSSVLEGQLEFVSPSVRVKAQTSGIRTRSGKYLHEIESELLVKYTVRNVYGQDLIISVHQTPLSERKMTHNPISMSQEDFHYIGIIAEDIGEFGEFVRLQPNETLTSVFDLGPYVHLSLTEGSTRLWLDFELRTFDEDFSLAGSFDMIETSTNTIDIVRGDTIEIEIQDVNDDEDGTRDRRLSSSSIQYEGGRPYWNYVCADVPADQTGYTYSGGTPAPCSALLGYCSSVGTKCPVTCNTCSTCATLIYFFSLCC